MICVFLHEALRHYSLHIRNGAVEKGVFPHFSSINAVCLPKVWEAVLHQLEETVAHFQSL